jgi:hypothetical protein
MELMAMIPGRNCAWDEDCIESYALGTLPEEESAQLEEHLLVCESCQARVAREDAFASGMRHAALRFRLQSSAGKPMRSLFPRLFPVLACAAMVLIVVLTGRYWIHPAGTAPAFAVKLEALRGAEPGSTVPAGRPLSFQADLAGVHAAGPYRLELVDRDGRGIWKGATANATIPGLAPGTYFMRLYSGGGELLREYGLEAR